jgi:hypothetical protein
MKEYLLLYHTDYNFMPQSTPEEMQAMTKRWMDWIGGIAAQNKLVDRGNRLQATGKVIKSNGTVTNGPFAEIKESIGGYTMIRAASYEDAVEIGKGCPVLIVGGSVEVREIAPVE